LLDTTARSGQPFGMRDDVFPGARGREPLSALVEASLRFSRGGGRTVLARQRLPYPFHATRPFYLDRARPEIATLYLQSASGGLYRGDSTALSIIADSHASVHITTQASTIVHRSYDRSIVQKTRIDIGEYAFAAMTPDPLVLFPGAEIACTTEITLAATANAILMDGLAQHDPEGKALPFGRYSNATVVRNADGTVLLADRGSVTGELMLGPTSPLGPFRAAGTLLVLGAGSKRCDPDILENRLTACGCTAGMSKLPNEAGFGGRILAANGGSLARGLEIAFAAAFEAVIGIPPARRRK
jgi:urease accessory protein